MPRRLIVVALMVFCVGMVSPTVEAARLSSRPAQNPFQGGGSVAQLPGGATIDPAQLWMGMNMGVIGHGRPGLGIPLIVAAGQQRQLAESQERYQIQSAQTSEAFHQSAMMKQRAFEQANANYRAKTALRAGYDPKTGIARNPSSAVPRRNEGPSLFDVEGKIAWPQFASQNPRREVAEQAIAVVMAEAKANGSASVASTVSAKQALQDYGIRAIRSVPGGSKILGQRMREFLVRLDESLDALAEPPPDDAKP